MLKLSLACGDYDRTRPIIQGEVRPEGIDLTVIVLPSPERHRRMLRYYEFDVAEVSLAAYIYSKSKGAKVTAIPIFPHRRFRHSYVFINKDKNIKKPRDLIGKKVGLRRYLNTAGVWMRGILKDFYGINYDRVEWITEIEEAIRFEKPSWLRLKRGKDKVERLLLNGEIDAAIYPEIFESFLKGDGRIGRLFENYKEEEINYFKRTGIFPPMHTVVIKDELLSKHPWIAMSMHKCFTEAKKICFKRLEDPRKISLAWAGALLEEERKILGKDPWPYNIRDNKRALETLIRYLVEQGILGRKIPIEDLFVGSMLDI
jgi:4,5-dihydroxyphthalate decarboxylase